MLVCVTLPGNRVIQKGRSLITARNKNLMHQAKGQGNLKEALGVGRDGRDVPGHEYFFTSL
jgi:hypothetical protein